MVKVKIRAWTHPQDELRRLRIWHMAELHDSRHQPVGLSVKIICEHHYRLGNSRVALALFLRTTLLLYIYLTIYTYTQIYMYIQIYILSLVLKITLVLFERCNKGKINMPKLVRWLILFKWFPRLRLFALLIQGFIMIMMHVLLMILINGHTILDFLFFSTNFN